VPVAAGLETPAQDPVTPPTTVARGTAYGLAADGVMIVSALAISVIVARVLGPANRGVFFLAQLSAMLIALVGDLGLSTSGLVFAATRRVPLTALHGAAVALSLVVTGVAAVVVFALEGWLTDTILGGLTRGDLWLMIAGVAPLIYARVAGAMLTGIGQVPVYSVIRIVTGIAAPLIMVPALWISDGSTFWAIFGWLAGTVLLAAGILIASLRHLGAPLPPSTHDARDLFGFGLRAYFGTISYHGFLRIDVLFISARSGPAAVGQYSLASVLAERISIVGSALYGAAASHVGSAARQAAELLIARMTRVLIVLLVPAGLVLAALAQPLMVVVFGSDFEPAALPFVLLLPGTICLTIWSVLGLYILAVLDRPGLTTIIQAAAVAVSIPLYWFAVGAWGMTGAAIVSSGVYASVMIAAIVLFCRTRTDHDARLVPHAADLREAWQVVAGGLRRIRIGSAGA
jgi:O-antigen/teichoic acid export membrane protein